MHLWKHECLQAPRGAPVLAVDFDGTMAPGSAHAKLIDFLIAAGIIPALHDLHPPLREAFALYGPTHRDYLGCWVEAMFRAYTHTKLSRALLSEYARTFLPRIKDDHFAFSRALLEAAREAGYALVMITHGPLELMHPLAEAWGFHHAIANALEVDGQGFFTGRDGRLPVKDRDLCELVYAHGYSLSNSIAMGDTLTDLPMLRLASYALAVNPDARLRARLDQDRECAGVVRVTEVGGVVSFHRRWAAPVTSQPTCIEEQHIERVLPSVLAERVRESLTVKGVYVW